MKIILDAMGGDHAPEAPVAGAVEAVKELDVQLTLVGIEDQIRRELKKYDYPQEKIDVIHASETISMHEPASISIRKKKDSSISVATKLLKEPEYDAFISAGNTGAVVAASTIHLRMLEGVHRPAIGLAIPTLKNFSFLIDVGANTEPKPRDLLQTALMGLVYTREVLGVESPTIGLLNIGEEESKGNDFAKETHKLLADRFPNFIGNVEANEIYSGKCDCIICDGFLGNVVIKVSAGLMESTGALIKREVKKDWIAAFGALLMKLRLKTLKRKADYSEYGGAPLLGVNGIIMISHGRSSPKAIKNAIKAAMREVEHDILSILINEISSTSPNEQNQNMHLGL